MPTAVVVGARHLGGAILDRLIADGWRCGAVARSEDTLSSIRDRGAHAVRADALDSDALAGALSELRDRVGPLDLCVNAVSVAPPPGPDVPWGGGAVADAPPDRLETWGLAVIRQSFVFLGQAGRLLREAGRPATVVQIANAATHIAPAGSGIWAAGWHGVRALTQASAQELRGDGIHVCLLRVDGPIASAKTAPMVASLPPDAVNSQAAVANAVVYLAAQGTQGRSDELVLAPARSTSARPAAR